MGATCAYCAEMRVTMMRVLLAMMVPQIAFAAEAQIVQMPPTLAQMITFAIVQLISACAYLSASLADWAAWKDSTGTERERAERRLKLIQGAMVGLFAGNVVYYAGVAAGMDGLTGLIGAGVGAYGGERTLARFTK
jgi:hypothetical protein